MWSFIRDFYKRVNESGHLVRILLCTIMCVCFVKECVEIRPHVDKNVVLCIILGRRLGKDV